MQYSTSQQSHYWGNMLNARRFVISVLLSSIALSASLPFSPSFGGLSTTVQNPAWMQFFAPIVQPLAPDVKNATSYKIVWQRLDSLEGVNNQDQVRNTRVQWKLKSSTTWRPWISRGKTASVQIRTSAWQLGRTYQYRFEFQTLGGNYLTRTYSYKATNYVGRGTFDSPLTARETFRFEGLGTAAGTSQSLRFSAVSLDVGKTLCRALWREKASEWRNVPYYNRACADAGKPRNSSIKLAELRFTWTCSITNRWNCYSPSRFDLHLCGRRIATANDCYYLYVPPDIPYQAPIFWIPVYWIDSLEGLDGGQFSPGDTVTFTEIVRYKQWPKRADQIKMCAPIEDSSDSTEDSVCFYLY